MPHSSGDIDHKSLHATQDLRSWRRKPMPSPTRATAPTAVQINETPVNGSVPPVDAGPGLDVVFALDPGVVLPATTTYWSLAADGLFVLAEAIPVPATLRAAITITTILQKVIRPNVFTSLLISPNPLFSHSSTGP